jgi:hypothetical protein
LVGFELKYPRGRTCILSRPVRVLVARPRGASQRIRGDPSSFHVHAILRPGERFRAEWIWRNWCAHPRRPVRVSVRSAALRRRREHRFLPACGGKRQPSLLTPWFALRGR